MFYELTNREALISPVLQRSSCQNIITAQTPTLGVGVCVVMMVIHLLLMSLKCKITLHSSLSFSITYKQDIHSLVTSVGSPGTLSVRAFVQSANHAAIEQCRK